MGFSHSPKIVMNGLVSLFDAGNLRCYPRSGTTTTSLIGAPNTGTLNAVTYSATYGGTFDFGLNPFIETGNDVSLQITGQITLSAWVNPTSFPAAGNIISKNGNSGWRFRMQTDGALWFYVNGNNPVSASGLITTGADKWYHLCVSGNSTGLYGYINGELVMSNTTAFAPGDAAAGNVILGAFNNGGLEPIRGRATLFKIYNRLLSQGEIVQNFSAHRSRFGV